ncbi:hypothetical protein, partial [Ruthenibacterium lactatiformans]|uniref:hypothetical protein n=1 Tax=Ruthenibacterium lactatiformans TaxID=1550024 RepID=UPI003AB8520C
MTIFDVVAFKMVTALASSTATAVTASDWESVITAMTGQVSVATIVGVLATVVAACVPFPVSWTVKMKKKQKETQDILSYHTQAAGCSDKARAKASGGRQP